MRSPPPETAAAAAAAERDRQRQIFRLHQDVWRTSAHQSVDVCRINSMFSSSAGSVQPDRLAEDGCGSATASELPSGDGHVYEDVRAPGSEPTDTCSELGPEPIYAVVDVRAKRSRRLARLLEPDGEPAGTGRKVSVSLPQISDGAELTCVVAGAAAGQRRAGAARSCSNYDDYEDVNFLVAAVHRASEDAHSVGSQELFGEHIYEPIRVAETRLPSVTMAGSSSSLPARAEHTGSGLWRQLKRLHLDGSWRRLTLRTRDTRPAAAAATGTVLEGLGRRLDSHRRSIKQRLKSLRDRIDPTAPPPPDGPPACPSNTSTGSRSRKSRSLDSFLRTEGPDGATEPAVLSV
uniref:Uncharacterized protein n=1 Tax=Anopheles dirus TaxID=7168 RepID=A0A182N0F6_9DIPT